MVNWKDPEVEARLGVILNDMVFFVLDCMGTSFDLDGMSVDSNSFNIH
jgi:hypothetical protein